MAVGAYDANGIYQYGESDPIALFSDLLNIGQESTSDAFTDDRSRITFIENNLEAGSTFVASSAAARNSRWGIPANATEQLALQNSGARTVRTDLGYTEQYFGVYNASTNPGGRDTAGWYKTQRQNGLVPIQPTSVVISAGTGSANALGQLIFNNATYITLNGIFSAEYRRYRVLCDVWATAQTNLNVRYTSGGSVTTSNNYYSALRRYNTLGGSGGLFNNPTDTTYAGQAYGGGSFTLEIASPYVSGAQTIMHVQGQGYDTAANAAYYGGSLFNLGSVFDGLNIWVGAGNITGAIQVFGYND